MRARADEYAPVTKGQLQDPTRFFRSGQGGEWRTLLSAGVLDGYGERADALLTPTQREWLERA